MRYEALYFGPWGRPGHALRQPGGVALAGRPPFDPAILDGGYAPRLTQRRQLCWVAQGADDKARTAIARSSQEWPVGWFLRHFVRGYSLIAWWDRSQGETRPGGNSVFIVDGERTVEGTLKDLEATFPEVVANLRRANIELRQAKPGGVPTS